MSVTTPQSAETILVPLDGSAAAEVVVPVAMLLARHLPAQVNLLHVIERDAPQRVHGERHLTTEAEAAAYLRGFAERFAAEGIPVSWHVHMAPVGNVPLSIAAHAAEADADLIVLSAHGAGDPRSWLTGAVAQGVIRHAAPPVLLLRTDAKRGEPPFAPEEVTVAIDPERQGEAALPAALELARALDVPLRLMMVVPTVETLPGDQAAAARLLPSGAAAALDLEQSVAADYLRGLADRIKAIEPGVPVVTEVVRGDPADALRAAMRARPRVMALATHGRAGFDALWSGSIGSKTIARGGGPFLLVHPEPASATS